MNNSLRIPRFFIANARPRRSAEFVTLIFMLYFIVVQIQFIPNTVKQEKINELPPTQPKKTISRRRGHKNQTKCKLSLIKISTGATISNPRGKCRANDTVAACHDTYKNELQQIIANEREAQSSESTTTTRTDNGTCDDVHLPLNQSTAPRHCWPRTVLLTSWPTSGNELVRKMFHNVTGLIDFSVYGCFERGLPGLVLAQNSQRPFFDRMFHHWYMKSWGVFPTAGRTALAKTHMGRKRWFQERGFDADDGGDADPREYRNELETYAEVLSGVVRLVRNPGDHLLRDTMRQLSGKFDNIHFDDNVKDEKLRQYACSVALENAHEWVRYHEFWFMFEESFPLLKHLLMYYERFSDPKTGAAAEEFTELLSFTQETPIRNVNETVRKYVHSPRYVNGELMIKHCGLKITRLVHLRTSEVSEKLGYQFDKETHRWFL
eukprot:CAMPEP_0172485530 /NCGR_PEP_ID=MMETSP1066-20121228/13573_1 /TAXON_ID=671091 /ORGANISM="Coscinodiscus wailesii, Strain CCMP2513" /LENGTH=434 /DNA_ID=CAMNT_0013250833 /DNA_START=245 /DNA_END=1549 /DNA_ORIENTATION=+